MAQMTNNAGVQTETSNGWGAQFLANGPKFMAAAALILIGAFIAVRVFIGEFVDDPKVALALTAISCVVGACVVALAPLFIWIIRETAKASMAGITPQISETNQLVKSSIEQNAAVMSALITLTSQTMNQRAEPVMQLPPAPQPVPQQIQQARADMTINGGGIEWDRATLTRAAARIYHTLYSARIEPTQANIKLHIKELQATSLVSAAMKELKALGWAESNGAGSAYRWIYDDPPANSGAGEDDE